MAQQVGSLLWQAAANAASVAGAGGSSSAGAEGASCEGCGHSTELPDTTAVLVSLLAVYPGVRRLEVFTKVRSGVWLTQQLKGCNSTAEAKEHDGVHFTA